MKAFLILLLSTALAHAAAYTSTQDGDWSSASTWGGSGPPGTGDTATLAHNVTVDAATTVGTSPNDATTAVVTLNASKILTIAAGITLTVQGNISWNTSNSGLTLNSGASLVFDANASGGSPVYQFIGSQVNKLVCSGTANARCSISAVSGKTWLLDATTANLNQTVVGFTDFTRHASGTWNVFGSTALVLTNCVFDSCGIITLAGNGGSSNGSILNNRWTNSTDATEAFRVTFTGTTGTRVMSGNVVDKLFTYNSYAWKVETNFFVTITCPAPPATNTWLSFRNNLVWGNDANTVLGLISGSVERNYWVHTNPDGNPHFLSAKAVVADNRISQNIFESHSPDLIDVGDCIIIANTDAVAAGEAVIGLNNIVLPSSYTGATVASGTLLTQFAPDANSLSYWLRNTANIDTSDDASAVQRGAFAFSEAGDSPADGIRELKSNVAWGSSSGQGFLAERVAGSALDAITPSGANYNWVFNTSTGDNLRSYEDKLGTGDLWTAGNSVGANVDDNQGSGDPQFSDPSRNLAKWCFVRGYGSQTFTNGLSALQANVSRIPDLIAYVFEGFRPGNASMRNAAHDGGCVGAANYYKSSRSFAAVNAYRNSLIAFGIGGSSGLLTEIGDQLITEGGDALILEN